MTKSEYRKNNLNGCFYDMKAQSKHFWNEIYRVRKNAMRLRVAKNLRFYRFWLSSDGSFGEGGCTKRLSLTLGTQSPSYVVLRTNHRFVSKLVLWATRSIKQPFRLFYLHLLTKAFCDGRRWCRSKNSKYLQRPLGGALRTITDVYEIIRRVWADVLTSRWTYGSCRNKHATLV